MSAECSECEWDTRAGHHVSCSRHPSQIIARLTAERNKLRAALVEIVDIALKETTP